MGKNTDYTITVNADKRYYIKDDTEDSIVNDSSLLYTVTTYHDIKMDMYNVLYDKKYLQKGPMTDSKVTYSSYLKEKYHISDYYCGAIYSEASAALSSQDKIFRDNIKSKEADIKAREFKIASTEEDLNNKKSIRQSIVKYIKTGQWDVPYPTCRTKVDGKLVSGFRKDPVPIDEYERHIEDCIRKLKTRLALLKESLKLAKERLEKIKSEGVKRIVFGGKALYAKKDKCDTDIEQWKKEFYEKRHSSMSLPGRHTSKYGNFLCAYDIFKKTLTIICIDGKKTVLKDFLLSMSLTPHSQA